jgi:predicted small secreted protein
MLVGLQLAGVPPTPLNVTVLAPWVAPKFVPVIVTKVPMVAELVDKLVMLGACNTVKGSPLLADPPTVTTTFPVVAPLGTGTTMLVALQLAGDASVPLNATVLMLCVAPKLTPVIVTEVPAVPVASDKLVMLGACETVKGIPLLASAPTVTTTFPDVAPTGTGTAIVFEFQLVGVARVPLNVTVLAPWVEPKFAPSIVTEALGTAMLGERLVIEGAKTGALKLTATLAKVAVASELVPLFTAKPT